MATATLLRNSNLRPPSHNLPNKTNPRTKTPNLILRFNNTNCYSSLNAKITLTLSPASSFPKFLTFSSSGEVLETDEAELPETQDNSNEDISGENEEEPVAEESPSPIITALQLYKEASSNNDELKIAKLETFFKSIEDEKNDLERKLASLSDDLYVEKERVLRISAEFDNFRKRTERERLSLVTNAKGEIIETFLPVLDNFERAKSQIKIGNEAEEKINNSYQSIYKQFVEILGSIGIASVETTGKPFDPTVGNQVGSNLSQVLGKMIRLLNYGFSGFMRTWIR